VRALPDSAGMAQDNEWWKQGATEIKPTSTNAQPGEASGDWWKKGSTPVNPEPTSLARSVGDSAIALGTGVAQGVKMLSDAAGAGNAVSRLIGKGIKAAEGWESDERNAQKQERAQTIKAAEDSGSTWEEVKAYAGSFADAPLDTTLNAVGSVVPTLAAAALTGGGSAAAQLAARAAPMAIGAVQGAGAVKGGIYDAVEQRHLDAGATPEHAAQRADVAQEYSGDNLGSIATGAGLGVLAGSTGAESAVRRLAGGAAAKHAADESVKGIAKGAALGAAKEAPLEAVQGGQERLAANMAEQGEGFDTPTMRGVVGQAALEGLAAAPLGGGLGAVEASGRAGREAPADAANATAGALLDAPVIAGDGGEAVAQELVQQQAQAAEGGTALPVGAQPEGQALQDTQRGQEQAAAPFVQEAARAQVASVEDVVQPPIPAAPIKPSAAMGINPEDGPLSAVAAQAVDSGTTDQLNAEALAQQVAQTSQQRNQPAPAQEGVDAETGEVSEQAREQQILERLDYLGQQGRATGWTQEAVSQRDALQQELDLLNPALRMEQLNSAADAADAEARDWASRKYKPNTKPLPMHAAQGGAADVGEANEQRRIKAIGDAKGRAKAARDEQQVIQEQGNAAATLAAKHDTQALRRMKTEDMSTQELQALAADLGPRHVRAKALEKAIQNRALQAQPAIDNGVNKDGGTTFGNNGAQVSEPVQSQQNEAAAQQIAREGNASREEGRQRKLEASERWTRMTTVERQAAAGQAKGLNAVARANVHKRPWADLTEKNRAALLDVISPAVVQSATENKAVDADAQANSGLNAAQTQSAESVDASENAAEAGQDTGNEWATFSKETGTKGIPRAEMPQVPTQSHGGLVKHLNAQGIAHETTTVDAASLKPTQAEYSPTKVAKAKDATGDRAVIVSKDGHIIDGHHQAMAAADDGKPVKAIVLDVPVDQALEAVKASPSVQKDANTSEGSGAAATENEGRSVQPKPRGSSVKKAEVAAQARADYFTTGNIVKSYGGHDRVIAYSPPGDDGRWSVTVRAVRMEDGAWVDVPNEVERQHFTEPGARELKSGPVVRVDVPAPADSTAAHADTKTPKLDAHVELMDQVRDGKATADQMRESFGRLDAQREEIAAELNTMTKDRLLRSGGYSFAMRHRDSKKPEIVSAMVDAVLGEYSLGRQYGPTSYVLSSSGMVAQGKAKAQALRELVANLTNEDIAQHAKEMAESRAELKARREASQQALDNPKTLADFRGFMSHWREKGDTNEAAFLRLNPEQRKQYDGLEAESTRAARDEAKRKAKTAVATAGDTTGSEVIATKHTKHGHELFVVQLADRVERDAYTTLNNSAKRLGGSYSSYRGNGAIPGFQFRSRESAEAFRQLVNGDTTQAETVANARRDAFDDDKSQSASERLNTMAEALERAADESMGADRKVNTARRARFAASADAAARHNKALAGTMRNVAKAIDDGSAKFVDGVRQKVQVEHLMAALRTAKDKQLRAKYPSYSDQERHKGEPLDSQTVDFADWPEYSMFRSDWASLARQLLEVDGGKKLGASLLKTTDDVTDAYSSWAKANLLAASQFNRGEGAADFPTREGAERAIKRAGFVGKAVVLAVKRGQNRVILSPGEAMQRGLWAGDGDKRIKIKADFVDGLMQLSKRRGSKALAMPWQLEGAYEKRQRLARMGILTAAEYRSALREFAQLQQEMGTPDRIKELERSMVGRKADGLDFFPTSPTVVSSMLDAAEIQEGMAVLEPSAGMGHIADSIVAETGVWPDVVELSGERRELLELKGFHLADANDFTQMQPRAFFTFGDTFRAPDGTEGVMRGSGGLGSQRVRLVGQDGNSLGYYDRSELVGVAQNGTQSGYDRIVMNPPFSDGRDIQHVQHAYSLLRPGGRIVAIMGEGAFFQSNKRAEGFREWLDTLGATNEKLPDGSFMDPSLPVNTGVSARMVVIDKPVDAPVFRRGEPQSTGFDVQGFLGVMNQGQQAFSEKVRAQAVEKVQGTVDAIRKAWANGPDVVVAYDMADPAIPEAVRQADLQQRSGGASGEPEGFYHQGKAYLLASQLKTPNDAARVLFHEALGHHGLRGVFGKELDGILNQIATMRKADVDAKILEYGLRDGSLLTPRIAAEEVLAEMAQSTPEIGFVKRAVAAIRTWLRKNVPGFQSLKLTDAEIINNYLLPARAWVENGGSEQGAQRGGLNLSPAMSRSAMKSVEANIARGEESLAAALNDKTTVHRAMFRNGLGWVDFVWGAEGEVKPNGKTKGAMGLSHILEARQRKDGLSEQEAIKSLSKVVTAIASGKEVARNNFRDSVSVKVEHAGYRVALTKNPGSNAWVVTAFDLSQVHEGSGIDTPSSMQPISTLTRDGLGADSVATGDTVPSLDRATHRDSTKRGSPTGADDNNSLVADGRDGNTMFSRSKLADLKDKGMKLAHDALTHPGKVSLWDRSVGTMRHVSERYPAFKPVFEAAQQFIDDVSSVANQAAQVAPRLIPRVETIGDMAKRAISVGDNKAIGKALFGGTLDWGRDQHGKAMPMDALRAKYQGLTVDQKAEVLLAAKKIDPRMMAAYRGKKLDQFETIINQKFESTILKAGAAFTHKELKEFFNLTDQQISLYDEARATVDKSLDITARAEMLRTLGRDWDGMRDIVMDAPTLTEAWKLLDDELEHRAQQYPDTRDRLATQMQQLSTTLSKAQELMAHGYMPLQRFGKYTLDVVDQAGERLYYGMFESKSDSNRMKEVMQREFPGARITQGTMNEHKHKLMAGITPETAELFGSMLGLDAEGNQEKDKAFQEYLKLAKNNHSAMKRLIHRKGILGYSDDVGRVLASFVYSNARVSATGLNAGKMETAINDLNTKHKEEGELGEIAAKLRSYIQDPQEEGQAIRGMLFAQYLGGSLASAAVNMTQPFAVTLPWLSQYGGMAKASKYMTGALRDMVKRGNKYEPDLAHALRMAEDDGVVSPQEIHQLMAQARGAGGLRTGDGTKMGDARAAASNYWEKVKVGWGQPFALAEQFNRRSTFIAAYRLARDRGMDSPAQFARDAVVETQFLYTKANKAQWARGAVGGTLFTFKAYSVNFLELMHRTWNAGEAGSPERAAGRRAVGWAMLMLMLMGGAGGMPFVEDVEDLVDGVGQMMGYNLSSKQWRKDLMREVLGTELAEFMDSGLSGVPGAPIDVSGRLGMGNLIPGTGLLLNKQSNTRDMVEMLGPAGDLVARGFSGAKSVASGIINRDAASIGRGAMEVMPTAVRNADKGRDMAFSGMYKDTKGYKVVDTTLDEALWKAIGFQPRSVAQVQESNSFILRSKSFYTQTSNDIRAQWAKALFEKDDAAVVRVRERLAQWNEQNPDQPIRINMPDIWKRARNMGKDRTARIADTSPTAIRQQMREFAARE